jgi:4-alpha-glucanotransferase
MGRVNRDQLRRRAEVSGVATSYRDWQDRTVIVADETLMAILDALGSPGAGETFGFVPPGCWQPGRGARGRPAGHWPNTQHTVDHPVAPAPRGRDWGFTVQLYSVRSRGSWGHGDLRDLADLAAWSARDLGAGFVLINPLHAAEPTTRVSPSPYLPMSRHFVSPLYLRIEDIPEYEDLPADDRARIEALARPLRQRNTSASLIDRDAVWRAKRAALEIIHTRKLTPARRAEFERFRVREGQALDDWATWCALAEIHGPDWREWPDQLRTPSSHAVAAERTRLAGATRFHTWLQWLADEQLAKAQAAAKTAGMSIGIINDLAVGAHPGGADGWAHAGVLVPQMSVGAPPDEFNQRGQDWGQPPWHPAKLAAAGYQPLAELIRAGFRHGGGLRADHVMGLFRLWWVPQGVPPGQGTYVYFRHEAMVGVLTGEAARAGGLAIGEDLGTVAPWIHDYLAARGVLGTSMLWFEREPDGSPRAPARWRRACLATVGTHDLPPTAAFLTGEQVTLRARLGLLTQAIDTERQQARLAIRAWLDALAREGLIRAGTEPAPAQFTEALYGYLARTPAALVGVSLADAVGDRRPQNMPGTTTQYPNWQAPLCDGEGRPVLLEELAALAGVHAVARAVSGPGGPVPGSAAHAARRRGPR